MRKTTEKKAGRKPGRKPGRKAAVATAAAPAATDLLAAAAPVAKIKRRRVAFSVRAEPGSTVAVAGDFNAWDPAAKPMEDKDGSGLYKATVTLAPGAYEYKFVINGTWTVDPDCKEWVQNSMGTLNSVIRVE